LALSNWRNEDVYKKSLNIPKGQSEATNRRRTDNTIAIRQRTKRQTTIYKIPHRKQKLSNMSPTKTGVELWKGKQFLLS
jgi:predicted nucleic acid binding AN1-type Zn finger protein